ncbi:hypothetical protein [Lactiplantibacillus modestisalitolerans]|uniref:Uncharacterized protein n=1 Tax=Lactiplantibacillus modestisalitolerans TaxID=1457219 RepID=A0ABV5WUE9_9LACO|nr:hypothetical protein [Lactiplantibacillus modestisalitolerans]
MTVRITILEPTDKTYPAGHANITPVSKKLVREELKLIPARLYPNKIYAPSVPITPTPALIPHSLASASLVAEVLYRKFVLGVPLYDDFTIEVQQIKKT